MKIRNGFVSNSSSSSFILYGSYVDDLTQEQKERFDDHPFLVYDWDDDNGDVVGVTTNFIDENLPLILTKEQVKDALKKDFPEIKFDDIYFVSGTHFD